MPNQCYQCELKTQQAYDAISGYAIMLNPKKDEQMSIADITLTPIGVIHSCHANPEETPIQFLYAKGCKGHIEIFPEFVEGLRDLDGFQYLYLLYHFHRTEQVDLVVKPFLQDIERGVFATRSPRRPNHIGLSIVELILREGNLLYVDGLDILEGTPLLDIKPYVARFDHVDTQHNGWQDEVEEVTAQRRGRRGFKPDNHITTITHPGNSPSDVKKVKAYYS